MKLWKKAPFKVQTQKLPASGIGRFHVQHPCCGMVAVSINIVRFKTTVFDGMDVDEGAKGCAGQSHHGCP